MGGNIQGKAPSDCKTAGLGLREEAEAPDRDMHVIIGAEARSWVMGVSDTAQQGGEGRREAQDVAPRAPGGLNVWRNGAGAFPLELGGRGNMCTLGFPGHSPQDLPWGEPGIPLALSLPQGGQTISDISANVNVGSQEKLFTTEATARYESWDAFPQPDPQISL